MGEAEECEFKFKWEGSLALRTGGFEFKFGAIFESDLAARGTGLRGGATGFTGVLGEVNLKMANLKYSVNPP